MLQNRLAQQQYVVGRQRVGRRSSPQTIPSSLGSCAVLSTRVCWCWDEAQTRSCRRGFNSRLTAEGWVRSVKCEVRSVDCEVWSVDCEVWSVDCEVWSVDCEVWSVQCEVWSVRFGVWRNQWEVWSVKFEVWSAKSAVCSVRCGVSREGHGRDRVSLNYRSFMFGKLPPPACPGLC